MPGSDACGRCGTSLQLAAAAIDVHPPRAGAWKKRVRRAADMLRIEVPPAQARSRRRNGDAVNLEIASVGTLLRMLIPGLPQFSMGRTWTARLLITVYAACLVVGLIRLGTPQGAILLGMAFSVHSTGMCHFVRSAYPGDTLQMQIGRSMLTSLLLAAFVYAPAWGLVSSVASPYTVTTAMQPLERNDVILVNSWSQAKPGRIVLYDIPLYEHDRYAIYSGQRVDRILGGAGDQISWREGSLFVNGMPAPWQPLSPVTLRQELSFQVPAGSVFILPSGAPDLQVAQNREALQGICLVPIASVHGQVFARNVPLTEFKIFR
jgi:hypothetical protein